MPLRPDSQLLDELAVFAGTLARHPMNRAARAEVRRLVEEVGLRRKAESLKHLADRADAEARERAGFRADLEG